MRRLIATTLALGITGVLSIAAAGVANSEGISESARSTASPQLRSYGPAPFPAPTVLPGLPGGRSAPADLDPTPRYVPQTSCDPREKPGITAFKRIVMSTYPSGRDWGSVRNCTDDGISEHLEGRAWDWNVNVKNPTQFAQAAQLLTWLTSDNGYNARRFGIMYIGYNSKIWGAKRVSEGSRPRNNRTAHTDHVRFSFPWNGAQGTAERTARRAAG